jgi:hypothetical protein
MTKSYLGRNRIVGQFAWRLIEMLESPAYRALSHAAHRLLARLEIELAHHGGRQNGKLPVTYEQMAQYGIRRKTIPAAIREAVALGFVEVTERGHAGNAEFRTPSKYRLTYRHVDRANPTDEWRCIKTDEEATTIAKRARQTASKPSRRKPRKNGKQKTGGHFAPVSGGTSPPENGNSPGGTSPPTVLGGTSPLLSISRAGAGTWRKVCLRARLSHGLAPMASR